MTRDRRTAFVIDLGQGDQAFELYNQIEKYRKLSGWTRKYVHLMGMAEIISKQGDNSDLVLNILNYLEKGQ